MLLRLYTEKFDLYVGPVFGEATSLRTQRDRELCDAAIHFVRGESDIALSASASSRETVLGEVALGATAMLHWNLVTPSGEVIARIRANGSRRFYWKDHLGSIRAVTDSVGYVYERHDYDAWGSELAGRADSTDRHRVNAEECTGRRA